MDTPKYTNEGYGRYSKNDIEYIKKAYGQDNDYGLKFLRKVFLPGLEPDATIGALTDPWSSSTEGVDINKLTAEETKIYFLARQALLKHLEMQLQALKIVTGMQEESDVERNLRLKQNSSK